MAIRVEHNVSGRRAGNIAFATGQGQRRERDLRVAQQRADQLRREQAAENARQDALALRREETAQGREDAEVTRQDRLAEAKRTREFVAERDVFTRAGKVADQEFGRESTSIAGREAEERRAREFALAAKHKADGDERQYTIEQQRKKDAINSSRVKIDEGVADGTFTEFQAQQMKQLLDAQELNIAKVWGPKKITPQDELKQRTFTADNGTLMYVTPNGDVKEYPGQMTPQEKLEATEKKETQEYEWEQEEKKVAFEAKKAEDDFYLALRKQELTHEEATKVVEERFAPPASPEDQQITQQLKGIGMTDDLIDKAVQQEGSLQAVIQRIIQESEEEAPVDEALTQDEFLKGKRPPPSTPTGGVGDEFRSLSGFGGAGGGRF